MNNRVLLHTKAARSKKPSHFDYPVALLAKTDHFSIYCDPVRVPRDREHQDRRIVNAKIGPS